MAQELDYRTFLTELVRGHHLAFHAILLHLDQEGILSIAKARQILINTLANLNGEAELTKGSLQMMIDLINEQSGGPPAIDPESLRTSFRVLDGDRGRLSPGSPGQDLPEDEGTEPEQPGGPGPGEDPSPSGGGSGE